MFALVLIAVMAAVVGTWIAYERDRGTAGAAEPPVGSWRQVFAMVLAVPLVFVALLLGA